MNQESSNDNARMLAGCYARKRTKGIMQIGKNARKQIVGMLAVKEARKQALKTKN